MCNVRWYDEGKIKTPIDCRKLREFLTSNKLKASQFAGDGGSIISRIIELERKTKTEFEHAHVKQRMVMMMAQLIKV